MHIRNMKKLEDAGQGHYQLENAPCFWEELGNTKRCKRIYENPGGAETWGFKERMSY
jgi:hypothetical protein